MIDRYIAYIRDVRRYSPRTQELYRKALEDFQAWADGPLTENLIPSRIREYEARLMEEGLSPRTVHLQMSALSGFCNFLLKAGILGSNPVKSVRRPRMSKRLPEYATEKVMADYLEAGAFDASAQQLEILLSTREGDKLRTELYRRRLHRLIVVILYSTGIRRAELLSLKVGSIDSGRRTMRVRGKGDKMREIPLVSSVTQEISLYLHAASFVTGRAGLPDEPLLVTEKGKPLYPEYVERAVKAQLAEAGVTGRKSPHVMRHSLATALLSEGADLSAIKEMLGHANLAATEVYTHNSIGKLKAQYTNAHPRAKKDQQYD